MIALPTTSKKSKSDNLASDVSTQDRINNYFQNKSDKEIWQLFKNGHEGAFQFIYQENIETLFRFGTRFTSDKELILDCIQDLFVELRNSQKLSQTNSIRFYLLKAFKNKLKRNLAQGARFQSIAECAQFLTEPSTETLMINDQLLKDQKIRLKKAIDTLPLRQREALYYFYRQNFSYQQVSEIMGFKYVRSARNIIYKALNTLRSELIK